jgi:hypothetical protein
VNFELYVIFDLNGMTYSAGTLILSVSSDSAGGSYTWPDDSQWASFNLSGLTQPAGTVIDDVTVMTSPYEMVSVTLNNVDDTAYEDLYDQIYSKLNVNPYPNEGSSGDPNREAAFMLTDITNSSTLTVYLSMDTDNDEIVVSAMKM